MRQHCNACGSCAFKRSCPSDKLHPGTLGGSPATVYIGQAEAGFYVPCHSTYVSRVHHKDQRPDQAPQCAGFLTFRRNLGLSLSRVNPMEVVLFPDRDKVFASYAEFLAHHENITLEEAERILATPGTTPKDLARKEIGQAIVHLLPRKD